MERDAYRAVRKEVSAKDGEGMRSRWYAASRGVAWDVRSDNHQNT